jgi:hypothetical protein
MRVSMVDEPETEPDRAAILARRQHFATLVLGGLSAGCIPCLSISPPRPPGVYLCETPPEPDCEGCDELERGNVIVAIDGVGVLDPEVLETRLGDGQPHALTVYERGQTQNEIVQLRIGADAEPLCSVSVEQLERAPNWAQQPLLGHPAPALALVDGAGHVFDNHELRGRRWLIVAFDWATPEQRQHAALVLQVLQNAQADLRAEGVELMFAQVPHPYGPEITPMSDADLRQFFVDNQLRTSDGGPLPPPPMYRTPNRTESTEPTDTKHFGESPNVVIVDERGVVRWHSAGATPDPSGEMPVDAVYTINAAVLFARDRL